MGSRQRAQVALADQAVVVAYESGLVMPRG